MSEYVLLQRGDVLPAVATVQLLLKRTGESLQIDGDFGPRTETALRTFQTQHHLVPTGRVEATTWARLVHTESLPIVDCIDIFDSSLYRLEYNFLTGVGGTPITLGGMCNGIEQAVNDIRAQARNLFLLRFHGHGARGVAGVSDGHGDISDHSSFEANPATRRALERLRGVFGRYGCIQFMHCETGGGPAGARFLRMAADATGVPTTGALRTQYAGTLQQTLRYEGPTRTVCPGGRRLSSWGHRLPEFAGMSFL